jgi:antitoxin ParD1/3/4
MLLNKLKSRIMETPSFEKFSITLPAEMARVIRARVSSGDYGSASEVIREAMRTWLERQRRLAALDESIARGIADADAGRVHEIEDVRKELRERFGGKDSR